MRSKKALAAASKSASSVEVVGLEPRLPDDWRGSCVDTASDGSPHLKIEGRQEMKTLGPCDGGDSGQCLGVGGCCAWIPLHVLRRASKKVEEGNNNNNNNNTELYTLYTSRKEGECRKECTHTPHSSSSRSLSPTSGRHSCSCSCFTGARHLIASATCSFRYFLLRFAFTERDSRWAIQRTACGVVARMARALLAAQRRGRRAPPRASR